MYKMLIVDDEKIERKGIISLIKRYNFEIEIFEAKNGKEALASMKKESVDILLTDIRMPIMDGLELCKQVKCNYPNVKIIINSAYSDFSYAQQAIGLNVINYMLKPIELEQFQIVMKKVLDLCEQEQDNRKKEGELNKVYEKVLTYEKERLLYHLLNSDDEINLSFNILNQRFQNSKIQLLLIDFNNKFFDVHSKAFEAFLKKIINNEYEYLNINEYQSIIFLIKNDNEYENDTLVVGGIGNQITKYVDSINNEEVYIVIGKPLAHFQKIHMEYQQMEEVLGYKFYLEGGEILYTEDDYNLYNQPPELMDNLVTRIYEHIEQNEFENLINSIKMFFTFLKNNNRLSIIYVKYIFTNIMNRLYKKINNKNYKQMEEVMKLIAESNNMFLLKEYVISAITNMCSTEEIHQTAKQKVMEQVIDIIQKEYDKDISLDYIAKQVYLSSNYLSCIFKQSMGESLVKYINRIRLEEAKRLLSQTNIKIIDVGKKVGFSNNSYFCTIFKNNCGISPSKYRVKVGRH